MTQYVCSGLQTGISPLYYYCTFSFSPLPLYSLSVHDLLTPLSITPWPLCPLFDPQMITTFSHHQGSVLSEHTKYRLSVHSYYTLLTGSCKPPSITSTLYHTASDHWPDSTCGSHSIQGQNIFTNPIGWDMWSDIPSHLNWWNCSMPVLVLSKVCFPSRI